MKRYTPCDDGACPYDAQFGNQCRNNCGVGADEDTIEIEDFIEDDEVHSPGYTGNAPCDTSGYCSPACQKYWVCNS